MKSASNKFERLPLFPAQLGIACSWLGFCGWALIYRFQIGPLGHPWRLFGTVAVAGAGLWLVAGHARCALLGGWHLRARREARHRPRQMIALCALTAVAVSCYPIIVSDRSFAGPGYSHASIVYDTGGALPGLAAATSLNQGADVGVLPWALVPNHFIVQQSILQYHEWPFWNRYSSSGSMLLGQMQSGLGDPLQLLVWADQGGAWGWDAKYLAAKFLFCLSLGIIALRATKSGSAGIFTASLSAFLGAFMRTFNHPEFFVLTSSPVILLTAAAALEGTGWRRLWWALGWAAACMTAIHSGAIKGGALSCLTMTTLGWSYVLLSQEPNRSRGRLVGIGAALVAGLFAINLPLLWPFIVFRDSVYTGIHISTSAQPLHQLLGLFDYLFYRAPGYGTPLPPATLVHLPLLIFALVCTAHHRGSAAYRLLLLFCAVLVAAIFGVIPPGWLESVPILNRIGHLDRQLGYQLAGVGIPLLAAFGWCSLGRLAKGRQFWPQVAGTLAIIAILVGWQALKDSAPPWTSSWRGYASVAFAAALLASVVVFAGFRLRGSSHAATIVAALAVGSPAFARNIFIRDYGWDKFFMVPGPRPNLTATGDAIDALLAGGTQHPDPGRVLGTRQTLFGNYEAVWRFEDIRGYNPMINVSYERWLDASDMIQLPRIANWVIAVGDPARSRPLLNVLNVRQLASMPYAGDPVGYSVRLRADLIVAENQTAWPRAFFAPGAMASDDFAEFWRLAHAFSETPFVTLPRERLIAAGAAPLLRPPPILPAHNYRLTPNRTAFAVNAPGAGWVFLSEAFWPGHVRATLNGAPTPVERADGVLEAIKIPSRGHYEIQFHYIPDGWDGAALVGLLGISALATWIGWLALPRSKSPFHPHTPGP